jgi:hypothetical protein
MTPISDFSGFVWVMCHVQFVLFTTKITKATKGSDDYDSELRALRVLRGENLFTVNLEESSCA